MKFNQQRSETFRITNGTRQGSVLSPALWCVYLDDLLVELRKLKLGCYVEGVWLGACAYADDLLCMAPTRSMLQEMVKVCQQYGEKHNMIFSTDSVPARSKTKCIYVNGKIKYISVQLRCCWKVESCLW